MAKELHMDFSLSAEVKTPEAISEVMESLQQYFTQVINSMVDNDIIECEMTEFGWIVEDPHGMETLQEEDEVLIVPAHIYDKMDKLVAETRISIRTPLMKHDPEIQAMYNGMEMLMAILDDREPDLVDRYGVLNSKGGIKK